jgi:AhpD family alkylhydroperoxidase
MKPRLPYETLSPEIYQQWLGTLPKIENATLSKALVDLIYLRVSQINGCAYCLELHARSLRAGGEANQRLDTLAGWRVSPHFTERERAALAWVDAVTNITEGHAPDEVFAEVRGHYSDAEISDMTFAIAVMNGLNRLAISLRK